MTPQEYVLLKTRINSELLPKIVVLGINITILILFVTRTEWIISPIVYGIGIILWNSREIVRITIQHNQLDFDFKTDKSFETATKNLVICQSK